MSASATVSLRQATTLADVSGGHSLITTLGDVEYAMARGLRGEWSDLISRDPHATLFQTPAWCLAWYRAYRDAYDPMVVVVREGTTLAGLVPLAVQRATRQLTFAGDSMADYRDVVALGGSRRRVLERALDAYVRGGFPDPLPIGWLDPASPTRQLLEQTCRERGLSYIVREQPCYRWSPPPPKKPSAQKFLNWFKRQGAVSFDLIDSDADWSLFREEYYQQHSLRQIQAGRKTAFDDLRHRSFYDALFCDPDVRTHVTAFRLDGRTLAGHFGYIWNGVLLLGPPAMDLEHEQRSPAVILLSWIIQNAERLGLKGFDLTIGDSDFKRRLGNQCVTVSTIDVYHRRGAYFRQHARTIALSGAKWFVGRTAGPSGWTRVKRGAEWIGYKLGRMREAGVWQALRAAAEAIGTAFIDRRRGHIYAMAPGELRPVSPQLNDGDVFVVHANRVEDLLRWHGASLSTASAITACARAFPRVRHVGGTLHTAVVDGALAGWGYSYYPKQPAHLTETPGAQLAFEDGAVSLYDFHVLPEFRGRRIYQALLTEILRQRFAEGAVRAHITVLASNHASRVAIERVGFRLTGANLYQRVLGWSSLKPLPLP